MESAIGRRKSSVVFLNNILQSEASLDYKRILLNSRRMRLDLLNNTLLPRTMQISIK